MTARGGFVALLVLGLAALLVEAVLTAPAAGDELARRLAAALPSSGVEHPVTAVLLAFRAYDTLLEVAVLVVAAVAARAVAAGGPPPTARAAAAADPVLGALVRVLVPPMLLVAAWLLWAGKLQPGGAFQAAAVLGAVGVLLHLADAPGAPPAGAPALARTVVAGLGAFIALAWLGPVTGSAWFALPVAQAGALLLALETVLMFGIAATLYVLYATGGEATTAPGGQGAGSGTSRDPLEDLEATLGPAPDGER